MTVCVAAIATKSKAIVMIADKAITYGTERPMQAALRTTATYSSLSPRAMEVMLVPLQSQNEAITPHNIFNEKGRSPDARQECHHLGCDRTSLRSEPSCCSRAPGRIYGDENHSTELQRGKRAKTKAPPV
jgi:hypothetical protein